MKNVTKYIIVCSLLIAAVVILSSALSVSSLKNKEMTCSAVRVVIADSLESRFVSRGEVLKYLERDFGSCVGAVLSEIDLKKIENLIDAKSAVLKSEAYVTKDGALNVEVVQRKPLVRFQGRNCGFYSDAEGFLFPLKNDYAAHVIVVDGAIPMKISSGYKGRADNEKWVAEIIDLVTFIKKSDVWAENIVQIHVSGNGDLILVPREGRERFIFGKPEQIQLKFEKMKQYYTSIAPSKEENYYSTVNLKYSNQIICKR